MSVSHAGALIALAVCISTVADALAQVEPSVVDGSAAVDTGFGEIEEIIVRGRGFGELRFEIRRLEEALFARFNDINSTDDFDIHCRTEVSSLRRWRSCQTNFARELQGRMATAVVRQIQGRGALGMEFLYAQEAQRQQRLFEAEMRELSSEDEQLREAIAALAQAQFAFTLARGNTTLSREVTAASGTLPYGAERMFEIIMGVEPYRHRLTRRTFTLADVLGEIRKLHVDCAEGRQRMDYANGVDWTVPTGWSSCTVRVDAKRGTTFRLYEF